MFLQPTQKVEGRVSLKHLEVLHPSLTCFRTLDKSFHFVGLNFHGSHLRGEEQHLSQGCNHVQVKCFFTHGKFSIMINVNAMAGTSEGRT